MAAIADIMPARSSTAAAIRPSRSTWCWTAARWAAPRCRPAPPPARTRRWNCATATSPLWRQGRAHGGRRREGRDLRRAVAASRRPSRCGIDHILIDLDGTPNKSAARRQRDPGVVAGRGEGGGGRARPAALPLCRRRLRPHLAGAADEHPQRRQARRQSDRHPGIHDHAGRRADAGRGGAHGLGDLPCAEQGAARRRPQHQCRRRGRLRART